MYVKKSVACFTPTFLVPCLANLDNKSEMIEI